MNHGNVSADIAQGLQVLQERIKKAKIPSSKLDESLNIATWNIREFGKKKRLEASVHFVAEIISQFDLVAIVELRDNLGDLKRVLDILGPTWRAVFSDYNVDSAGNHERIAYVFDKRAVVPTGLAAEADPLRKKDKKSGEYLPDITWWRSPYMVSFRAGKFDFVMIAAHIRWAGDDAAVRVPELRKLAEWIDRRRKEPFTDDKDVVLVGDFNIPARQDATFKAITDKGLMIPRGLLKDEFGSNLEKDKRYDQILVSPVSDKLFTDNGGVLDYYAGDYASLFPGTKMTKLEFTFQLSDHLPLWMQLNVDNDAIKLDEILRQ